MTKRRKPANSDAPADPVAGGVDLDIDVNRVVWDQEYRREILAALNRSRPPKQPTGAANAARRRAHRRSIS